MAYAFGDDRVTDITPARIGEAWHVFAGAALIQIMLDATTLRYCAGSFARR